MRFEELEKRVEKGYLRKVVSPCGKLVLFNYTDKCIFDKAWDEYTLYSRGTVYEIETGNIVAHAFNKFFNYSEHTPEMQQKLLTETGFDVYENGDTVGFYNDDTLFYEGVEEEDGGEEDSEAEEESIDEETDDGTTDVGGSGTPGFDILLLLGAVVVVVLLFRRNRRI